MTLVHTRLPEAAQPFLHFTTELRRNGFAVSADQTALFIEAVGVLGPRSISDIYQAALATLAPPVERREAFDALYRLVFLGHSLPVPSNSEDDDDLRAFDERDGSTEPPDTEQFADSGEQATDSERTSQRELNRYDDSAALHQFTRLAPVRLPVRKSYRRKTANKGDGWDMRSMLRNAIKYDGEVLQLPVLARKTRRRRIVLLIDISGSMKAQTDAYLQFAHVLSMVSDQLEVFTLGTRLTRVSRALKIKRREQALQTVATLVADWDGGTRLGDALEAFLAIPRFSGFSRGALVVLLSDGLERGDHSKLTNAVERLSRTAWKLLWLTPLAADKQYEPRTGAMQSMLPFIDVLGDGASIVSICRQLLNLSTGKPLRHVA